MVLHWDDDDYDNEDYGHNYDDDDAKDAQHSDDDDDDLRDDNGGAGFGGGPVTIIALAPLTNIATAMARAPELFRDRSKVARVVWMGGAVAAGGNATAWAEANAYYDPEAAAKVLSFGVPITM